MECADGVDTARDGRLSPAHPSSSSQFFSLLRRKRRPVAVAGAGSTFIHSPIITFSNIPRKPPRPTAAQQRALSSLATFDPVKVYAWLKVLQCLASGYQHYRGPALLTPSQLSAASELKSCEEDRLLSWQMCNV